MRSSWLLLGILGCSAAAAPAREPLRWRPGARVVVRECPSTPSVKDLAAARDGCKEDDVTACLALLARRELAERDARMARDRLATACLRDPVCGCAAHGTGLTWDALERFDRQAIETLRVACVRGALAACDEIDVLVGICEDGTERILCAALREGGRAKPVVKPPRIGPANLPPALTGCFTVERVLTQPSPEIAYTCIIDPSSCAEASSEGGFDPSAPSERLPPYAIGSTYCFEPDRASVRPPGGAWDQWITPWNTDLDHPVEYSSTRDLRLRVDGQGVTLLDERGSVRLARAQPERPPRIEDVCAHARRCTAAIDALLPPQEPADAPPLVWGESLARCVENEQNARRQVKVPPRACE